jgi:hypothetical protein
MIRPWEEQRRLWAQSMAFFCVMILMVVYVFGMVAFANWITGLYGFGAGVASMFVIPFLTLAAAAAIKPPAWLTRFLDWLEPA